LIPYRKGHNWNTTKKNIVYLKESISIKYYSIKVAIKAKPKSTKCLNKVFIKDEKY